MKQAFGSYLFQDRIGVGGMGEVYRATKRGAEGFEVEVAIKVILPHLAREESFRRRFSREARVAASLRHPNIIQVNGFDIHNGTPFIEMELVKGRDLASLLKSLGKEKPLTLEEAVFIIHETARGLAFAHSTPHADGSASGIIHRDLSPHNILISVEGEVKIADFGIARAAMAGTAASGTLMGKLAYMSPEQIDGLEPEAAGDLFSLGTIAYQLLSGIHPFVRSGEAGTLRAVQEARPEPLSTLAPDLPHEIATVVQSLLSRSPENRPESAMDVALAFQAFLQPAAAKKVGDRIRAMVPSQGSDPSAADSATASTLPPPSRRRPIGLAAASVLAAAAFFLFLSFGIPLPVREAPVKEPVGRPPSVSPQKVLEKEILPGAAIPVSTVPEGARIFSGTSCLGLSPMTVAIPPGIKSRELSFTIDGYAESREVLSREKEMTGLLVTLKPLPTGTLRIGAIPWARVIYRGSDIGVTPVVIEETPIGPHDLLLYNDELEIRREMTVRVQEGQNPVLVMDMATGRIIRRQ